MDKDHATADVVSLNFHQVFDKAPPKRAHGHNMKDEAPE